MKRTKQIVRCGHHGHDKVEVMTKPGDLIVSPAGVRFPDVMPTAESDHIMVLVNHVAKHNPDKPVDAVISALEIEGYTVHNPCDAPFFIYGY